MTPSFSARRRADEFEALLSRGPDAPVSERDAARFSELLEVVGDLRALPEVTPRAEFTSSLREALMAEADTVLVRRPAAPSRLAMPVTSRTRQRGVAVLLGGAVLAGATASVAVAAQTSLPGESLYGVKRGIESAQVRLAGDDAARGRVLLAQADRRLDELEEIAAGDGGDDHLAPSTLDTFTEQTSDGVHDLLAAYADGGSQDDVQHARDFTTRSMERLDALEGELPAGAQDQLVTAGRTLSDLDLEVSFACAACSGGITSVPDFVLTSAPVDDLLTGLDVDNVTLEAAPVSGQDLTGIEVPTNLPTDLPSELPTGQPSGQPSGQPTTTVPTTLPTTLPTDPVKPDPTKPDPTKPVKDLTGTVTDTTSTVVDGLDTVTGGALGGLTTSVDDATGGLIGSVTGTLDTVTGGTLHNATGHLLP